MKLPHLTFYPESMRAPFVGKAHGPVILIRRDRRHDHRLWAHEYEHVRQWYLTLGLHPLLYVLSRRYRIWAEARGYARQARSDRSDLPQMARLMAHPVYRLRLTPDACQRRIERYM